MFAYGIAEWQEIGLLPGDSAKLFDISGTISADGLLGSILKGALNFTPTPTVLQSAAWVLYFVPIAYLFFKKPKKVAVKA
jgi:high-affinity iron transporter